MKKILLTTVFNVVIAFIANLIYADAPVDTTFANGADIGWLSEMESNGYVFKNDSGIEKDCMQILKEQGINSLRFRVWVNPSGGWCGKDDVAAMAKRAKDLGFRIMIDFHYSDTWADPGNQKKPAAWSGHTFEQLLDDIYNHTYDVLDTLKSLGVTPTWVQTGNETNNGMIWPDGKASTSMSNFAKMVTSGYNAIKAVDSTIQAIVQLSNGHDYNLYKWMFDGLKNNEAKWDIIGMSVYPKWANLDWQTDVNTSVANMQNLNTRYDKKVMVCETGYDYNQASTAYDFLINLIDDTKAAGGLGVFYWEPECYSWRGYNMGAWDPNTKQPTTAMDAFLDFRPTNIKQINDNEEVHIFPNPLSNQFLTVKFNHPSGTTRVRIFSVNGQQLREEYTNQDQVFFNDLTLPSGFYFVQISNQELKEMRKLVVK